MPLSFFYGVGSYFRISAYRLGLISRVRPGCKVISVGNLTVGGTGKTPVVIDLARRLIARGHKVAVLSRGYGRKSKAPHLVVSDGTDLLTTPQDAGDEPYLMALSVPGLIVIVGSKRMETQSIAVEKFGANVILLDDGFQHLPVVRDVDIVLWDYNDDPDSSALLPAGRLREPLSALGRASAVVISKVPLDVLTESPQKDERLDSLTRQLLKVNNNISLTSCSFVSAGFRSLIGILSEDKISDGESSDQMLPFSQFEGKSALTLCAIARPESFYKSLHSVGVKVLSKPSESLTFGDHHWFCSADIKKLQSEFERSGADFIATTMKDACRLIQSGLVSEALAGKIFALEQKVQWQPGEPPFLAGFI